MVNWNGKYFIQNLDTNEKIEINVKNENEAIGFAQIRSNKFSESFDIVECGEEEKVVFTIKR